MGKHRTFTMPFEPMTIQHLGLRLYSTLPPVISELVSNAYDAESSKVEITVPTGRINTDAEVVVRDWGHGLTAEELQDEYLPIGRNRRGTNSANVMSKNGNRRVTGRKGLGKLSAFGIAGEMEVRSVKNGEAVCLCINLDSMLRWATKHGKRPFQPDVVDDRSGRTRDGNGVEVRLRHLRRKTSIDEDEIRGGLARRLHVIGKGFSVTVNGVAVSSTDRVSKSDCAEGFIWDVDKIPQAGKVAANRITSGWLGFSEGSSQIGRGINIIAHGKAVELGSFFNLSTTHAQFARAHLVGEIHADFLDDDDDLVATARNSVVWESEPGQALQEWGQKALKWSFQRWLDERRKNKEDRIIKTAGFDKWLMDRQPREQQIARRMVSLLIDDPKIETESAVPLFEIIKSSVESVYFQDLIHAIEHSGSQLSALLTLFDEWRIIEARTHLKLADGRAEAMDLLKHFMDEGALEVQDLQPLLEEHLWLFNTQWTEADGQTTYTGWLRKKCKEPKDCEDKDRRIDILGVRASDAVTVTELKRPDKTLSRRDLEQIARYVDWARTQFLGTGAHAPKNVSGLLIVGHLSDRGDVQLMQTRLAGNDIRVETYDDLYSAAKEYYGAAENVLKAVAPEYARSRRKQKAASAASKKTTKKKSVKKSTKKKTVRKKRR